MREPQEYYVGSMGELYYVLEGLGPPMPETKRVFRGQTRQYLRTTGHPSLLPAASRPGFNRTLDPGWTFTASVLASALQLPQGGGSNDTFVWVPALLQHYGFGSYYLDVSADPLVALWFSLHRDGESGNPEISGHATLRPDSFSVVDSLAERARCDTGALRVLSRRQQ